jgi:Calcineurin-like phosphoesterase
MADSSGAPPTTRTTGPIEPLPMVGWYDPSQLARTAVEVVVSTVLGRHADNRLIEALEVPEKKFYDYTVNDDGTVREAIWIDYVADAGDGWDSTYTVAYWIAQARLKLKAPDKSEVETERGRLLILGGDEVYPTASRDNYERRLTRPYETALGWTDPPHPHVFAVAGNHDWYDSLVSFTRLFCSERWFGGWQTRQDRSYFALRLPHGWWLLGTDVQLDSDIDRPQVQYFEWVAAQMAEGDRVILCNAEPHWIYAGVYGTRDSDFNENNLAFLEEKVLKRGVTVFLAGDLHHYRRHEDEDGRQKITAGGGGAFLHPTHGANVCSLLETDLKGRTKVFTHRTSFPDCKTSRRLTWRNLFFAWLNPWFGILPAILYLLTAWIVMAEIGRLGLNQFWTALCITLETVFNSPAGVFWALAIFGGFLLFTDTHSLSYRRIAGPLHGIAHLAAAFFIGWGASYLAVTILSLPFRSLRQLVVSGLVILVCGYLAGSTIMGIYLLISLNGFGRHANEAFSALHIPDWKNFLRLRIDVDGRLTIFPVGIRHVSRKWAKSASDSGPRMLPDDPAASAPALIEAPVVVTGLLTRGSPAPPMCS